MTKVTFNTDVFPHVKGDVKDLDSDELKRVDAVAKSRNLSSPYSKGVKSTDSVDSPEQARAGVAAADRTAVEANAVDQAAQLEAQRNAVPEVANPDHLGVEQEDPQVVTGTEPVADVEVTNPQEATDIGSGEGAKVKGSKKK